MYKDVWKKFGLKIFIVLCSVLLVGGVAVAAPRLRGAGAKIDINDIVPSTQTIEYQVDPFKLQKVQGGDPMPQGGIGMVQYPKAISVEVNGSIKNFNEGTDYVVANESEQVNSQAGRGGTLKIQASQNVDSQLTGTGTISIPYTIEKNKTVGSGQIKAEIDNSEFENLSGQTVGTLNNYWVVNALPESFNASDWTIYINDSTLGKIPLVAGIDFEVGAGMQVSALGGYSASLSLYNYESTANITAQVYKNITSSKDIEITVDNVTKIVTVTDTDASSGAKVKLDKDTHYNEDKTTTSCTITGIPQGSSYYVGSRTVPFEPEPSNFEPEVDPYTVDYDLAGQTIENRPPEVRDKATGLPMVEGTDYDIKNFRFTDGSTNATAGMVSYDIVGKGSYKGTWTGQYTLTRSISSGNGEINGRLKVDLEPDVPNDKFEFNNGAHGVTPKLTFQDMTEPLSKSDYKVEYTLKKRIGGTLTTTNPNELTDAGIVTVKITGQRYYTGEIIGDDKYDRLWYEIKQKDVTNEKLVLIPNSVFELTNNTPQDIYNNACLQVSGAGQYPIDDISGHSHFFSKDQAGTQKIEDGDWGSLQPGTDYYIFVEFTGNYKGKVSAAFQVEEYDENHVQVTFGTCPVCGATNGQNHVYTGEAHEPPILNVVYQGPNSTAPSPIPPSAYEGKVEYKNNVNAGTATVTVPVSNKVKRKVTFRINQLDLTDGVIKLSRKDGFIDGEHDYTGYTKLQDITELTLETTKGLTVQLKPEDYQATKLFKKDAAGNITGPVTPDKIVADGITNYCFGVERKGDNLTIGGGLSQYAYTETFVFTPRDIRLEGENGIHFKIKPKKETGSDADYLTYIEQNLVITDKKLGETVRPDDYTIGTTIDTSEFNTYSRIKFSVTGRNCYYKTKAKIELYIGQNITKAVLKELKNTEKPVIQDPILPNEDESFSGTIKLIEPYGSADSLPYYSVGDAASEANSNKKITLNYYESAGQKLPTVLKAGEKGKGDGSSYWWDVKNPTPEPDDPNDTTGTRYATVVLTGKSGYYGTITLKVPIEKSGLSDYEIVFRNRDNYVSDDNVYTGEPVTPEFDVVHKTTGVVLVKGQDYIIPENVQNEGWQNNIQANEGKQGNSNLASLTIRGIYAYEGTLTQTFTIRKRRIGVESEVNNPDGTPAGIRRYVLNTAEGFRLEGWINSAKSYDYTPFTKTEEGEVNGVCPQLKLYYKDELLQEGVDYTVQYEHQFDAAYYQQTGMTYEKLPKIKFNTRQGNLNSNFTGEFEEFYEIVPVVLTNKDKCEIELRYTETAFTGVSMDPEVTVLLYRDGDKANPLEIKYDPNKKNPDGSDANDFIPEYIEDVFVTVGGGKGSNSTSSFLTHVNVNGQGNLQGTARVDYLIYGEFNPQGAGGKQNSEIEVVTKKLKYQPDATPGYMKGSCDVIYSEKLDGQPDSSYDDANKKLGKRHTFTEAEYMVTGANRIGKNLPARVESTVDYFRGGADFGMTIEGDLAAGYIKYKVQPIGYSGASTVELNKFLTVTYDTAEGEQALSFGTDYEFESEPTANLGKNEVNIVPIKGKSDDYLIGKKTITYYVTTGLDALVLENVQPSYPYAHGQPVLKPEDIIVKLGNNRLIYGVDYKIEIIGDATSVGTHTIVVTSANEEKFSGKKEQSFTITKYNLEDAVKDKLIKVNYINDEKNPYYTGSTVTPTVTSVTITTSSGAVYVLSDGTGDQPAEYEIIAGSKGDHVNWTSGDVKPDFILSGRGNYEGGISYDYSIKRKDISDASEVTIAPIDDIYYNNGKDITPVPAIQYRGRDLSGIRHSGNNGDYVNWQDYTKHFTYQYSSKADLKSTGTKEIKISGIGNFTGETTISYKVIPLNIKDAELVFTGETPVYDSKPQTPAFKLMHSGDVIMEWTGKKAISDFFRSTPEVVFGNNINATGEEPATVKITITDEHDNYQGSKETTFTILPASLDTHTKFLYRPVGENENKDLKNYKLNLDFIGVGSTVKPAYAESEAELEEGQLGIYYDFAEKANHGAFLKSDTDYTIEYKYVEPDTDDVDVREDYQDPDISFAGKVKVTITGKGNYADTATFWYFIGKDISSDATISMTPTTAVFNSQVQAPEVKVSGVEGLKYIIAKYKNEVKVENLIEDRDFINAGEYFIRIEGDPRNGTYATKPYTLTYTITPRAFSNNLVIDGFKREYSYTGYEICPVGISVTDYIDKIKYKLTEDVDYTLTYTNNLNAGTAYINIKGQNNFSGSATANFMITSSTISSGGSGGNNSFLDQGTGEISGSTAVSPGNVNLSMDTIDAMYYTGKPLYPKVSIAGMTENVDYTVTFGNNVEVGTAVATINGIGNNTGTIVKNFRIIAQLSKCTISPIPAQQYTGSEVKPALTVRCGNSILMEGSDYTVTYSNNINIGTATATLRALNNANYTGTTSVKFSIGNDVGGFIISGYAPSYAYTGKAITPGVVVETGSSTLTPGTDYTVSYSNNTNAGTATITVTGVGRYSGTQTANFIIEPKSIQSCDTTEITDRTYTGDAYTPDITVSDGGKVLTKGVDYTVTYKNNTNPGTASIVIQGLSSNYAGTKVISFKISAVAVKGLKASNVKYNSLKLKWTKQGYADGYQICDSKSKVIKTLKSNSATITGLSAGKTYKFKVRAYIRNANGTKSYGAFSSVLNATTKLRTPNVKVVSNAKGQARISWSKVSGASGYEIYYKKSSGAKYKKLKTVNNPNVRVCTVRGMKSGDRAYFRIRAFRKNGSRKVYSALNPLKVITVK